MPGSISLESMLERKSRLDEAKQVFQSYPDAVAKPLQEKVLKLQVAVGMDPYMAKLAGGAYAYEVVADPAIWPAGSLPEDVIMTQCRHPDGSKIRMIFKNDTQYPDQGMICFAVTIQSGRVASIDPLDAEQAR